MNYKKITAGLNMFEISEIGLGCWALGGLNFLSGIDSGWEPVNYDDAKAAICYAIANGINYFDPADSYGNGLSERYLGSILKELEKMK